MLTKLRRAHLYLAENKPAIAAPVHVNSAGIYYEQENPLMDESSDWSALCASLRLSINRFSFREANLRDTKKADWPAFRASGCRSVRQFEDLYLRIDVVSVNEAELFYLASCQPRGEKDIKLQVTLNRYGKDEEVDRLLRKLFKASLGWTTEFDLDE
jgi:hypothetical protein